MQLYLRAPNKRTLNDHLKLKGDISGVIIGKTHKQLMLSECIDGTDVRIWDEYDAQRTPIVKSYGVYNKEKNIIE